MITAAADGSSLDNPGPAGWAWYVDDDHWAAGGWPRGTNNMGELMAVLDLLRATAPEPLTVLCDSQYAINCCTKWLPGWKRKGWRKADGKPVLNRDLLEQLDAELAGRQVSFEWVRGHSGHPLNEAADQRARAAATAHRDGTPVDHGPGMGTGADTAGGEGDPRGGEGESQPEEAGATPGQDGLFDLPPVPSDPDQTLAAELVSLERRFLDTDAQRRRRALEELLAPDFVEHAASGRLWTRGRVLAEMADPELVTSIEVLGLIHTGPDTVALRWRSRGGARVCLRVSLWQRGGPAGWQLRFGQATPVR